MFPFITLLLILLSSCIQNDSSNSTKASSECSRSYKVLPEYKNTKNYLAFENFGSRGIGRCRGHSIVSQSMEMLAKYNPQKKHLCHKLNEPDCYSKIYQIVTDILDGKIKTINGFDSLYTFSQDPIAQRVLRNKVASISHRYAANDSILDSYEHDNQNINIFYDTIRRINLRHRPYLGIQGKTRIGNHALIAYKVEKSTKINRICVRDPNVVIRDSQYENCQNFLYIKLGNIFYHQYNEAPDIELAFISLQSDEDERVEQYILAHSRCK
jgi:hypothetical protein